MQREAGRINKVLFDLSVATEPGYGGIAQDTRLMFRSLAQLNSTELTGLVLAQKGYSISKIAKRKFSAVNKQGQFGNAAEYLAHLTDGANSWKTPEGALGIASELFRQNFYFPRKHPLRAFPKKIFDETLWRVVFQKTLPAADRDLISKKHFVYSSLTTDTLFDSLSSLRPQPRLDTRGYDFAIFEDARPVRIHPGTIKICRYHDAVPISQVDTQSGPWWTRAHFNSVNRCKLDSFWVCNSPGTKQELLDIFSIPEERIFVIPCAIQQHQQTNLPFPSRLMAQIEEAGSQCNSHKTVRYILSVSTLEPRKNFPRLIEAWERIISTDDPHLKLVIVGSPGWRCDNIVQAIKNGRKRGGLIHLQNVSSDELRSLYKYAEAFVFPSFAEGFGMPPVEALASSTVPIVADTPNSRWVLGESAIYVNPYDVEDIANGIRQITQHKDTSEIKNKFLKSRNSVLNRFSIDTISSKWEELFLLLKAKAH